METRLHFNHAGRQFFFITLVTVGRRAILSRREGAQIAALLPPGEVVVESWRNLHKENVALTASNFVIMPDHVHLLLIVDFDRAGDFSLLDFIYSFMRRTGGVAVWDYKLYFQLSFSGRQLGAVRRYIKMNPARADWKEKHPDLFVRRGPLRHAVLSAGFPWYAIGNLTILASPFLMGVRLPKGKTAAEHKAAIGALMKQAEEGAVLVSGFISKGEQEVLARLRAMAGARFIRMMPHGLEARFDPGVEDCRAIAEGRELILSAFEPGVAARSITRANFLAMNERIVEMVGKGRRGGVAYAGVRRESKGTGGIAKDGEESPNPSDIGWRRFEA